MTSSVRCRIGPCTPDVLFRIGHLANEGSVEKQLPIATEKNGQFHEPCVCQLPAFLKVCLTVPPAQVLPQQEPF